MPVEGSSHLGRAEAVKREQAERLLADVYDIVVLLVGAYADKILPHLLRLPDFPHSLPPDVVTSHLSKLGIAHDSTMAWVTEVLEHAGVPQPQRSAGQAAPVLDFQRLSELNRKDSTVRDAVADAGVSVDEAARQLASISPGDPAAQDRARQVLGQMISDLIAASARLMETDAYRAAETDAIRRDFGQRIDDAVRVSPHDVGSATARTPSAGDLTRLMLYGSASVDDNVYRHARVAPQPATDEARQTLNRLIDEAEGIDPTSRQGRIAPTSPI